MGIEDFLKFSEDQPKTILAVLLGIIVVGAIGGGIWINNLQSTIENRDKMISDRLALLEQQYKNDLRTKGEENIVLREEVRSLRSGLNGLTETISNLLGIVELLHEKERLEPEDLALVSRALSRLENHRKEIELATAKADAIVAVTERISSSPSVRPSPSLMGRTTLYRLLVALIIISVLALPLLGWLLYRRSLELRHLREQIARRGALFAQPGASSGRLKPRA